MAREITCESFTKALINISKTKFICLKEAIPELCEKPQADSCIRCYFPVIPGSCGMKLDGVHMGREASRRQDFPDTHPSLPASEPK